MKCTMCDKLEDVAKHPTQVQAAACTQPAQDIGLTKGLRMQCEAELEILTKDGHGEVTGA